MESSRSTPFLQRSGKRKGLGGQIDAPTSEDKRRIASGPAASAYHILFLLLGGPSCILTRGRQ